MYARSRIIAVAAIVVLAGCAKTEEAADANAAAPAAEAEHVRALVQKHADAVGSGNVAVIDSLTGAELVHVELSGEAMTEAQLLDAHRGGSAAKFTIDDVDIRTYGNVAVVNARISLAGSDKKGHMTQVWVRQAAAPTALNAPAGRRTFSLVSPAYAQDTNVDACCYSMVSAHVSVFQAQDNVAADAAASEAAAAKPDISAGAAVTEPKN